MKSFNNRIPGLVSAVLISTFILTACGSSGNPSLPESSNTSGSALVEITENSDGSCSCDLFAMDTVMQLKAYGKKEAKQALSDAAEEIRRLDQELNVNNESSPVYALNHRTADTVNGDTAEVLRQSLRMAALTNGSFDPTIYPIVRAWGFTTQEYRVPQPEEITELLSHIGYGGVSLSQDEDPLTVQFADDRTEIDTGGIGKGYASERVYEIMKKNGVTSAVVSLGGNVMTIGQKPDGSKWKVAIEDPFNSGGSEYAGVIQLADKYAITSGGYQRYFEKNGRTYIHIMDPATGQPVENDLSSVTIISDSGTEGDALSTALYVMGLDKAIDFWKNSELDFDIILISSDKQIYISKSISSDFHSDNPAYSNIHTVSR